MRDNRLYTYKFKQAKIWICGYVRSCHDIIQPFLELVDTNEIPSAITDRESYVGATNIPEDAWKASR